MAAKALVELIQQTRLIDLRTYVTRGLMTKENAEKAATLIKAENIKLDAQNRSQIDARRS